MDAGRGSDKRVNFQAGNDTEMGSDQSPSRRIRESSVDRLSALPDALIILILSIIGMKRAAITSVLSKRWKYLWSEVPVLDFLEEADDIESTRRFVDRVHRTLRHRKGNCIDELSIKFAYKDSFAQDVDAWVDLAVRNRVKNLNLDLIQHSDSYALSQAVYSCSSLTELTLNRCIVAPQGTTNWQSLTDLEIGNVFLGESDIQKILLGCPVLQNFEISECFGFSSLDIHTPNLHVLKIIDCEDEITGPLLEITAPFLRILHVTQVPLGYKLLRLKNVNSLKKVDLSVQVYGLSDITEEQMNDMVVFLEDIYHVEELTVCRRSIDILCEVKKSGWHIPPSMRKCLYISAAEGNENLLYGLIGLLESSPDIETLDIECFDISQLYFENEPADKDWGPVLRDNLAFDLLYLKTVTLAECASLDFSGEPMLTIAKMLLKRATTLEKMVIDGCGELTGYPDFQFEIAQKMLSFPRSSRTATVILHP